jgi:hypothetical protein
MVEKSYLDLNHWFPGLARSRKLERPSWISKEEERNIRRISSGEITP